MPEADPESPPIVGDETPWTPPAPHPDPELPANVIAVTYDRASKWWTARCGPLAAGLVATSNTSGPHALTQLAVLVATSGHSFDPDFTVA